MHPGTGCQKKPASTYRADSIVYRTGPSGYRRGMGSTYYSLHHHWVCSTKDRRPHIRATWRARFFEYVGGTIRGLGGVPLKVGGVEDHVHALIGLKPTHCISNFTRELKKSTSIWTADHC